jgi:flap endonuclease-1
MGITSINQTVREVAPEAYGTIPLTFFTGYRIAIDANEFLYSAAATTIKQLYASMTNPLDPLDRDELQRRLATTIIGFTINLMKSNITPIWCWDGEAPPEKSYIRAKRKDAKVKLRERIATLKAKLMSTHPLARTPAALADFVKLISQDTTVTPDEMTTLRHFTLGVGIPSVKAPNEAEKLCAALALEGLAAGVWSEDTDAYALGTPLLITGFGGVAEQGMLVNVVSLQHILVGFGREFGWAFTHQHLVDLCIMHGTDFNPNIPGIGPKRAVKFIKQYASIEAVAAYEPTKSVTMLNHQRVREIFAYQSTGYSAGSPQLNFNRALIFNAADLMMQFGCEMSHDELVRSLPMVSIAPNLFPITPILGVKGPWETAPDATLPTTLPI